MGNIASVDVNDSDRSILHHLDDDVLQLVCKHLHGLVLHNKTLPPYHRPVVSMLPLSLTCKRFRALCLPYIFQIFNLECYDKNPWWGASNKLKIWNSDLAPNVREVSINLCIWSMYKDSWLATWFIPSLPDTLAQALRHLSFSSPHLNKISLQIEDDKYHIFEAAFAKAGLSFPNVDRLQISPANSGMMKLCPNVKSLSVLGRNHLNAAVWSRKVLGDASKLPKLEGLIIESWCDTDLMSTIAEMIPKIKTLVIRSHDLHMTFEQFVAQFAKFRYVRVLVIPSAESLDIGFHPPGCGNAYFGPGGEEYRKQVEREGREAEHRAAKAVFIQCPQLEELWFAKYTKVTRGSDGFDWGHYNDRDCTWAKDF
ncbi:hypothetical protein BDY19DRAFT_219485 [Irpex rosettiformis]|uniref:Uncharacterized protein n=1 Tax=Irpex rosettiformis TaxID=378272 RepID=A0ACB8U0X1_9APHY|nr:hypothetical protein BDY19DRAFT_219485 [Irpex rosettiformis]